MHPGVSSYGKEANPPRFLYLKDECFLMTDWCDTNMKNSKSVTFTSRPVSRWGWGVGMEQQKILYQYVSSGKVSTRSIQRFKKYPLLETLTKNFSVSNIRQSINKIHLKLQTIKASKNFNQHFKLKFQSPWPWPHQAKYKPDPSTG